MTFFSLVSLYATYLRRCFSSSGLTPQSVAIDNNTTIHFWGPKTATATKKPVLIMIHGFGPTAIWQWRRQVQFFSLNFHVYVPDLVFFGDSTTKSEERSEIFQAVCLGKLMEILGVKKFHVMGTSYGGFVAYHMARMLPDNVEKVVIASSGVSIKKGDNETLLKRADSEKVEDFMLPETADQLRTLARLAVFRSFSMIPDFFLNDFVQTLYTQNRKEKLELLKGLTLGRTENANLVPLEQDVLIVWGEQDQIFPLKLAFELKELLGEKARVEVLKKTSHVPQVEDSGRFNEIVNEFLRGSS
ncbi:hypothetical protein SLE2022_147780 [Rubroshorea leprosula]